MKKSLIISFFIAQALIIRSQDNFFYGDTILEINQMKFETKGAMSYRDRFKTQVLITNLTDSFKIIDPADIKISCNQTAMPIRESKYMVIPPKCTRKFRFVAENSNFKYDRLNASISKINTTGKIESVYFPKEFILDAEAVKAIERDQFPMTSVGPLQLRLKSFSYKPNGTMVAKVAVLYNSSNFLGMHVKKIKLLASNGKTFVNKNQSDRSLYYYKESKEIVLTLEFENPYGSAPFWQADKLVFEDVFVEYKIDTGTGKQEIGFTKTGEGKGNAPKDAKEKDIEVIED